MALADPQSITIGASTIPLPRTSSGTNTSTYTSNDGATSLVVTHVYGRRNRRTAVVTTSKITTDPLNTGQNIRVSASVRIGIDGPTSGFTSTELKDAILGACTYMTAASGANALKLVGGEN